jgi:pheromone shutdown protein TraB
MKKNPDKKIMAIVGAGHEKEMISIIKKKINSIEII